MRENEEVSPEVTPESAIPIETSGNVEVRAVGDLDESNGLEYISSPESASSSGNTQPFDDYHSYSSDDEHDDYRLEGVASMRVIETSPQATSELIWQRYVDDLILERNYNPNIPVLTDRGEELDESVTHRQMRSIFVDEQRQRAIRQRLRIRQRNMIDSESISSSESESDSDSSDNISYNMWDSPSPSTSDGSDTEYHSYDENESDSDDEVPSLNEPLDDESTSDSEYLPSLMEVTDDEVEDYYSHLEVVRDYRVESSSESEPDYSTVELAGIRIVDDHVESINAILDTNVNPPPRKTPFVKLSSKTIERPLRTPDNNRCITMLIDIGGVKAYTMLNSGSTSDSLSPDFTRVAGLKVHTLAKPLNVQLGTVGSRSKINYGTSTRLKVGPVNEDYYFDVFNIDRYDCILGTPSIRKFGVLLDLANNSIIIDGK